MHKKNDMKFALAYNKGKVITIYISMLPCRLFYELDFLIISIKFLR
jgi:hypothetical protein